MLLKLVIFTIVFTVSVAANTNQTQTNETACTKSNEESKCKTCDRTCDNVDLKCTADSKTCVKGCYCKEGYARDGKTKDCIQIQECKKNHSQPTTTTKPTRQSNTEKHTSPKTTTENSTKSEADLLQSLGNFFYSFL